MYVEYLDYVSVSALTGSMYGLAAITAGVGEITLPLFVEELECSQTTLLGSEVEGSGT